MKSEIKSTVTHNSTLINRTPRLLLVHAIKNVTCLSTGKKDRSSFFFRPILPIGGISDKKLEDSRSFCQTQGLRRIPGLFLLITHSLNRKTSVIITYLSSLLQLSTQTLKMLIYGIYISIFSNFNNLLKFFIKSCKKS
jgi:hypothetical protein